MKLLIPESELIKYKSRDKIPLECRCCNHIFYRPKNQILSVIKGNRKMTLDSCSKKCMAISQTKGVLYNCKQCSAEFSRRPSDIKRNKNIFCSHSCTTTYNNAHKTWGSNRSKLEIWLENQLNKKYPILHIEYNQTNTINAELDIYIPSLKLAFELNGIFHYEPIFGETRLLSYQQNDKRKFQACLERGIELCIIDTHNVKYLKKERDVKFLDIITNIINNNLGYDTSNALVPQIPQI